MKVRKRDRPKESPIAGSVLRCAVYTRKSSEERLDQEFNSLDAQRESAEAFIASQKAQGWACLPDAYDDGGFSGGSMGRPVSQAVVRRKLPVLAAKTRIHKRVHAHGFRHTHASELRSEGIDIAVIKRQLGHSSLLTTIRYLDYLEPLEAIRMIQTRL